MLSSHVALVLTVVLNTLLKINSFPPHAGTFAVLVIFSKMSDPFAFWYTY